MKNLHLLLAICFITSVAFGQKIIEKNFDYKNQYIEMKVPFASDIEIKTWDKPTVFFKAEINTKDDKYLNLYKLAISEGTNTISIESEPKKVFEAFHEERNKYSSENRYYFRRNEMYEFNYVLYVPKNAQFKVSSINGSMKSEQIYGDFTAELINGNIDIKDYSGKLDLSTINGEIDVNVSNASFTAETVHGDIYADENLSIVAHDRNVGQKVESESTDFNNRLKLNTVNGNMYLRK